MIKATVFLASLAKEDAPLVAVLTGEEEYFRSEARAALIRGAGTDADVVEFRWNDPEKALDAVTVFDEMRTTSLFSPAKVVVLRDDGTFMAQHGEALARLVKEEAPPVRIVVEGLALVTKRGKSVFLSKALEAMQKAGCVLVDCAPLANTAWGSRPSWDHDLGRFTMERAKAHGKTMDPETAHALQAAEGGGLRGIVAQIERLAVQVGERAEITLEDVLETVSTTKESSVFEIVDAAAACETEKVLGLVGRLFDIGSTDVAGKRTTDSSAIFLRLLPLLSERFHQLGRLRELERDGVGFEQAAATVFGESKAWLFPRFRVQAAARTPRALGDAVLALARLEHRLKTGGGEARELFETFLVEHGSPLPHARARFGR